MTDLHQVLTTMSPTARRALRTVAQGEAHTLHGREISTLKNRGCVEVDECNFVTITALGHTILDLIKETP